MITFTSYFDECTMWLNVTGVQHELWHNYGKQDCAVSAFLNSRTTDPYKIKA